MTQPERGGRKFEYIRLAIDVGDLSELNGLSSVGFRVVAVIDEVEAVVDPTLDPRLPWSSSFSERLVHYALLERELP